MRGYNFYAVYESKQAKRSGEPEPVNCVAVTADEKHRPIVNWVNLKYEGLAPVFDRPNSPVAVNAIAPHWLRDFCKRIRAEDVAKIHPKLWERFQ